MKNIIKLIGDVPVIGLTATATPKVQEDILKNLDMSDAKTFKASFNRPNLFYEVRTKTKNIESDNIPHIIFHEWKSIFSDVKHAPGLRYKLMYVFGPPGWSHDGSKLTSDEMRKNYFANKQRSMLFNEKDFAEQEEMVA